MCVAISPFPWYRSKRCHSLSANRQTKNAHALTRPNLGPELDKTIFDKDDRGFIPTTPRGVCLRLELAKTNNQLLLPPAPSGLSQTTMTVTLTAIKAVVACSTVAMASTVLVPCSAGTRVYSLSVYSGYWVDGLIMRCTGDSDEQTIPPQFNDDPGGAKEEDFCAGTGGMKSIEWGVPEDLNFIMTHVTITCVDNETYHLANE